MELLSWHITTIDLFLLHKLIIILPKIDRLPQPLVISLVISLILLLRIPLSLHLHPMSLLIYWDIRHALGDLVSRGSHRLIVLTLGVIFFLLICLLILFIVDFFVCLLREIRVSLICHFSDRVLVNVQLIVPVV